jgi:hypothetical protein
MWEPWGGGEYDFAAIVMEACASWGRDVIATVYRLRVVIATPRIELSRNAGLIEICVPDAAAQAGDADCRFRASPIHGCELLLDESQCGPVDPTWPSDLPT